jgi:hypothetical protein
MRSACLSRDGLGDGCAQIASVDLAPEVMVVAYARGTLQPDAIAGELVSGALMKALEAGDLSG